MLVADSIHTCSSIFPFFLLVFFYEKAKEQKLKVEK